MPPDPPALRALPHQGPIATTPDWTWTPTPPRSPTRRLARKVLEWLAWDTDRADDAILLVSELVANAVRQAAPGRGECPAIILTLYGNPAELSILAWDNGPCDELPDDPVAPADDSESGRGLGIAETLTVGQWGWWETPHCGGKVIWAYL